MWWTAWWSTDLIKLETFLQDFRSSSELLRGPEGDPGLVPGPLTFDSVHQVLISIHFENTGAKRQQLAVSQCVSTTFHQCSTLMCQSRQKWFLALCVFERHGDIVLCCLFHMGPFQFIFPLTWIQGTCSNRIWLHFVMNLFHLPIEELCWELGNEDTTASLIGGAVTKDTVTFLSSAGWYERLYRICTHYTHKWQYIQRYYWQYKPNNTRLNKPNVNLVWNYIFGSVVECEMHPSFTSRKEFIFWHFLTCEWKNLAQPQLYI